MVLWNRRKETAPRFFFIYREMYFMEHKHEHKHINMNRTDVIQKITPLIENTAMRYGFMPIEIDFCKESNRWFLRIFIYSPDKPVTLDDCENISRSLSDFLDELIPVKYYLEVSSPGLDRKIKSDKEFIIFKGQPVSIKLKKPIEGLEDKKIKGIIDEFDPNFGLTIILKDNSKFVIQKENIHRAQLEIE